MREIALPELRGLSQPMLELGEEHFDGIEDGRVFRKEDELGADGSDGGAHGLASLWDPRLSIMTMSPGLRVGPSTLSAEHPFGIEKPSPSCC